MKEQKMPEDIMLIIDTWINELERYSMPQLCTKPSSDSWSLGQLYLHLIADTNFYVEQIKICLRSNENADKEASSFAKTILLNNDFPDERIEGAPSNAYIPQPAGKEQLKNGLINLRNELHQAENLIAKTLHTGKTKHPGLGYFSAAEWFQLAGMHFRHHVRQKGRIDEFLKAIY